jgi:hypothetical protein
MRVLKLCVYLIVYMYIIYVYMYIIAYWYSVYIVYSMYYRLVSRWSIHFVAAAAGVHL